MIPSWSFGFISDQKTSNPKKESDKNVTGQVFPDGTISSNIIFRIHLQYSTECTAAIEENIKVHIKYSNNLTNIQHLHF
jgi:hypothetical protein